MKIEELAAELNLRPLCIYKHWREIEERYKKYGITLVKNGRGDKTDYGIKNYGDSEVRFEPRG